MKQSPMVSFVIPVFNGEKHIKRCIAGLVSLDRKQYDIEIVVVDDGSTDRTKTICENIRKKDDRIRIIHKDNGGVSSARNVGIHAANGKYIIFVDGDDEFLSGYFNDLYIKLKDSDRCVFIFDYLIADEKGKLLSVKRLNMESDIKPLELRKRYIDYPVLGRLEDWQNYLGAKVFQYAIPRKILESNGLWFAENICYAEDMCFLYMLMRKTEKIKYIPVLLYKYYIISGSASHAFRSEFYSEWDSVFEYLHTYANEELDCYKFRLGLYNMKFRHCVEYMGLKEYMQTVKNKVDISEKEKEYLKEKILPHTVYEMMYKSAMVYKRYGVVYMLIKYGEKIIRIKNKVRIIGEKILPK